MPAKPFTLVATVSSDSPAVVRAPLERVVEKVYADGSLGAELLDRYRALDGVGDTFFAALVTGAWTGPSSAHWNGLADTLDLTAKASKLAGVRQWAKESASTLRRMAKEDLKREDEERLRY